MREILFKAKRIDNGAWEEGWLVPTMQNTYHDGYIIIDVRGINYDELDYFEPTFISWEIDPNTICQFTGLFDKNGKKIWENDIISYPNIHAKGNVAFVEDTFVLFDDWDGKQYINGMWNKFEVIGNVFDNKELLEE